MKTQTDTLYASFLSSPTAKQWKKIGMQRRAGAATPLFSLYSKKSAGIGEIPDLKLLIDWCAQTGLSIIQLLPLNDVGFNFKPYDAQSMFALEPMYLSVQGLKGIQKSYRKELESIRRRFPVEKPRVDYGVKRAKLVLLWKIFRESVGTSGWDAPTNAFQEFCSKNSFWLEDYACFKVIKEKFAEAGWEFWEAPFKERNPSAVGEFVRKHRTQVLFHEWLQWQLYEQFRDVKQYARSKNVLLMGDLPFLVSRDSADVWSHQDYFKLDLASGAPPDFYFAQGQRWGMPPYHWQRIAEHNYDYLVEKIRYSENFYDLFRIDHFVGIFRLWTIQLSEPPEHAGLHGRFDPENEKDWEAHGRRILSVMLRAAGMLPCAEDLGVVPECSYRVLEEFAIPGMDVQRWTKDWGKTYDFKPPEAYRKNSIAVISSHDMSPLIAWWEFEIGTVDGVLFKRYAEDRGINFEVVKGQLFDPERSDYGRLRWRPGITREKFSEILGRPAEEVPEILDLYLGSAGEKQKFWEYLGLAGPFQEKATPELVHAAMEKADQTSSIFSAQMLQDWLSLGNTLRPEDPWYFRINFPGTVNKTNWTLKIPFALEDFQNFSINDAIRSMNERSQRA